MDLEFYRTESGRSPVSEFLDGLSTRTRSRILQGAKMLRQKGPALPGRQTKRVAGLRGLWELRIWDGSDSYRVLFSAGRNQSIVLLHAFAKKTRKLQGRDVRLAVRRMRYYEERKRRG